MSGRGGKPVFGAYGGNYTRQSQSESQGYSSRPFYDGQDQYTNHGNNQRPNQHEYGYQQGSLNQIEGRTHNFTNFANPKLAELEHASYLREIEAKEKRRLDRLRNELERQRNMSKYAIKSVVPGDDDDDFDDEAPSSFVEPSVFDAVEQASASTSTQIRQPSQNSDSHSSSDDDRKKKKKHKKKSKKSKKKHKRSSSSHSSSSNRSSDGGRKKKHRHKRHNNDEDENDIENSTVGTKKVRDSGGKTEIIGVFDVRRNPWKLLKPHEYAFITSHIVVDTRGEPENLIFDTHNRTPEFKRPMEVLSNKFGILRLEPELGPSSAQKDDRYFSSKSQSALDYKKVERRFRKMPTEIPEVLPISHAPCGPDEECTNMLPERRILKNDDAHFMTVDDFKAYKESKNLSAAEVESKPDLKKLLLRERINANRHDIEAWIDYIDLQAKLLAYQECQNFEANVQNEKALYEMQIEIVDKAIKANLSSPELALKRVQLMERRFSSQSDEVKDAWKKLENKFLNNIDMWKMNIKMHQNDRATFTFTSLIERIDGAIQNLVDLRDGVKTSHVPQPETEQALVDLLVQRCKLLIAVGYIDKAVAMLQALTEYHLFAPDDDLKEKEFAPLKIRKLLELRFSTFWESGLLRIGETIGEGQAREDARGWRNYSRSEQDDANKLKRREEALLEQESDKNYKKEHDDKKKYELENYAKMDIYRNIEMNRASLYWKPIHFKHDEERLFQFGSRFASMIYLKGILFPFKNADLTHQLIYRLLKIFGIDVPGMPNVSSVLEVLGEFTQDLVDIQVLNTKNGRYGEKVISFLPNLGQQFDEFKSNFLNLLSQCGNVDVRLRIIPLALTYVPGIYADPTSHEDEVSQLTTKLNFLEEALEKIKKIKEEVYIKLFALSYCAEQYWMCSSKLPEPPKSYDSKVFRILYKYVSKIPDVWSSEIDERNKLLFLRLFLTLVRQLPFKFQPEKGLLSRRQMLISIFCHGNINQLEETQESARTAVDKAKKKLQLPSPKNIAMVQYQWIGIIDEMVFELAMSLIYELVPDNDESKLDFFIKPDSNPFYHSPLGSEIAHRPMIHRFRIDVLEHIVKNIAHYTPRELNALLKDYISQFPHEVFFIKKLIDRSTPYAARLFLNQIPTSDKDPIMRRVRNCARVCLEWKRLESKKGEFEEGLLKSMHAQLISVLKNAAQDEGDDSMPDDTLWRLLIFFMQDGQCATLSDFQQVFVLAQKQCPWSKQILFDLLRNLPSSCESFIKQIMPCFEKHELQQYTLLDELELI